MSNDITNQIRSRVRDYRNRHEIVPVAEIASDFQRSFATYRLDELKNLVLEETVRAGANARWE